ncbi:MAG: DNA-binding domain-containing protein [Pseudomonadota bacterium]|nr:DNA-binding domain-containing protein [Pseudomonadota bacterium]
MTTTLRELQEQFLQYVIDGNGDIRTLIVDAPQISIQERVDIYRDGYYLRLIDILGREFSVLLKRMGAPAFDKMCRAYIDAHPSTHFSVKTYGRHMMSFLETYEDVEQLEVELAVFEWAFGKVLEDADDQQLTLVDMAKLPPESWGDMRLRFHPSMRLIDLQYNTPDIWKPMFDDEEPPAPIRGDTVTTWMLWRFKNMTHYRPLTPAHLWMVREVQSNATFAELCEGLCEFMEEEKVAEYAGTILHGWLEQGLISGLNCT